jgi:flagellar basal-body rod modification protein FlgD
MSVTAVSSGTSTASTASTSGTLGLDSDAFLKLLCTQLQYQDPLNPMDSNEYMTQLAQLTQVETLNNIKSSLDSIVSTVANTNATQWFSTIGKKMNVDSSYLSNGDQVTLTPASDYDTVKLTLTSVKDGSTKNVTISSGESLTYTYDGEDAVTLSATATKDNQTVACTTSFSRLIKGVIIEDGTTYLVSGSGESYSTDKVKQIL